MAKKTSQDVQSMVRDAGRKVVGERIAKAEARHSNTATESARSMGLQPGEVSTIEERDLMRGIGKIAKLVTSALCFLGLSYVVYTGGNQPTGADRAQPEAGSGTGGGGGGSRARETVGDQGSLPPGCIRKTEANDGTVYHFKDEESANTFARGKYQVLRIGGALDQNGRPTPVFYAVLVTGGVTGSFPPVVTQTPPISPSGDTGSAPALGDDGSPPKIEAPRKRGQETWESIGWQSFNTPELANAYCARISNGGGMKCGDRKPLETGGIKVEVYQKMGQ